MKKYLARFSFVLWISAAILTLLIVLQTVATFNSNGISYFLFLLPALLIVSAISFILTGTINIKEILKMCRD